MARQEESVDPARDTQLHPLLVYHNLGRRYRPPALLLIVMGLFALLPSFIEELENDSVSPDALALVGLVLILAGAGLWLFSILASERSYVEVRPDVLMVRGPFRRTMISYHRIKLVQPVQVSQLYPRKDLKGMGRPLVRPLLAMTAVEVQMRSWPEPKERLVRRYGRYLFSPRADAWLFIVPAYAALIRQVDAAVQRKAERERGGTAYEDPIARLKYYGESGG